MFIQPFSLCSPLFCQAVVEIQPGKKGLEENNNFSVNKVRYPASGRMDPSNAFLTARVLSRN